MRRLGSWDILFSEAEQSIYIVPTDYHPEPFRISLRDLKALHATLSPKRASQIAPDTNNAQPKKKMRRHQKRKQARRR